MIVKRGARTNYESRGSAPDPWSDNDRLVLNSLSRISDARPGISELRSWDQSTNSLETNQRGWSIYPLDSSASASSRAGGRVGP